MSETPQIPESAQPAVSRKSAVAKGLVLGLSLSLPLLLPHKAHAATLPSESPHLNPDKNVG